MKKWNIPLALTWMRIGMIPLVVALYYLPTDWMGIHNRDTIGAIAFIFAALTDWLDGWLARRWNQTTSFGAFLDPVADKLMVCAALLILLDLNRVDSFIVLIIIGREITITALREWMATIGARGSVAVHWLGKFKTAAQMTAIPLLMFAQPIFEIDSLVLGEILIYVAAVLTIWSMCYYLYKAWPIIKHQE
ncbi:CDP-diacylglycerol--glycerol-3-phosphate 3-phosphatidyltransferase [Pelistega indica]|uniref:CDP-diacylglycerol--glycerol-3-phosphate 3-phosphatidyltransferase n=1 Tax=Pelistega indica TaxID=1414851 RepID=V8GBE6_9BURK|nr:MULTISPECIES: CDP-diacylglycerol--glycerol-3-phosphate 3-phosphatidyltransferase [Pelistega]ETD73072.1 CDP-diacylglycerol--glycerol-3-phosphate 3-phosphatidyltransferase [Pelistega indica]